MKPKRIVKGTRVRLKGSKIWWKVIAADKTGITCERPIRGTKGSTEHTWPSLDQVTHFSNKKPKGKSK